MMMMARMIRMNMMMSLMMMMQAVPGTGGKEEGGESLTREELQEQERLRWVIRLLMLMMVRRGKTRSRPRRIFIKH